MMIFKRYYLYILFLFFLCCNTNGQYQEVETLYVKIKTQPYKIIKNVGLFDTTLLDKRSAISKVITINEIDFISYINKINNSLVVYNLTNNKTIKKYNINFEIDKYQPVTATCIVNQDSIFTLQFNRICLLNQDTIIKSWTINNDTNAVNCIDDMDFSSIYFDKSTDELVLQQYCCSVNNDEFEFFKQSPITFFNIKKGTFRTPNIIYSKMYLENYYGFMNQVRISNDLNNTYLSYPVDPNIYILNRKTFKQTIVGGKSRYQKLATKPLNTKYKEDKFNEKKIQHINSSHHYIGIIVDNYRSLFYRFYVKDLPEKNEKGLFNTANDKEMVLLIFNNKFELLQEIEFEKTDKVSFINPIVTKDGLYLKSINKYVLIKQ